MKSADIFKHSYHVVATNFAFTSNTGPMKTFMHIFCKMHAQDELLFFTYNNSRSCIIDESVYTKNRLFRTPLSCKLDDASKIPLKLLQPWHGKNNIQDAFVTNVVVGAAGLLVLGPQELSHINSEKPVSSLIPSAGKSRKQEASTSAGGRRNNATVQVTKVAVPTTVVQQLQSLLDAAGSKGCKVHTNSCVVAEDGSRNFLCRNVETLDSQVWQGVNVWFARERSM